MQGVSGLDNLGVHRSFWGSLGMLAAATLVLGNSGTASVAAETIKVRSGVAMSFGPIYVYTKKNCEVMPPSSYSISSQPKHGKAGVFTRKTTLGAHTKCPGATGYALYFTYQSNKGYRGADNFRLTYAFERYVSSPSAPTSETISVEVR